VSYIDINVACRVMLCVMLRCSYGDCVSVARCACCALRVVVVLCCVLCCVVVLCCCVVPGPEG
jgi:hypothetical protein